MTDAVNVSRRALLSAPVVASLAMATGACAQPVEPRRNSTSSMLVAFFSRSGNTRVVAETFSRALNADLVEIAPARPYPADYEQTVAQARRETERDYAPPLAAPEMDLARYDTVLLAFPIWGMTAPPVIRSFLRAHDLAGKTLRPAITHGGYGVGDAMAVVRRRATGARIEPPFVMEADQERRTLNEITGWLERSGLR